MRPQLVHRLSGPINTTLITAPRKLSRPQPFVGSAAASATAWTLCAEQPLVGPETPSRRHTLQWPLLLMPGGNSRLRRREARWQDYNLAATVPHVVARCHRVHPAGSGGTCARPGVFNAPRSAPEPGRGSLAVWGVTRRNYWATPSHDSGLVDGRRETVRHDRSGAGPAPATESVGPNRLICCRAVGLRTASSSYG